jgi:glucuronate isomerase
MAKFLDEDFLLPSRACRRLYHSHAEGMPIFDFHCHLPARDIAQNRVFGSLTEAWLAGDHYKWRAMRACGVPERLITGDASDREKFLAWARIVPSTIGNPLYHWTHLELKRYFGVAGRLLGPGTADRIYDDCSALLVRRDFSARSLLQKINVKILSTTDDPVDSLEWHAAIRADASFPVTVLPTFRPDAALAVHRPVEFTAWVDKLGQAAGIQIGGWKDFLEALRRRHDFFHQNGCRASDHGIEEPYAEDYTEADVARAFGDARSGVPPAERQMRQYKSAVMLELARMDADRGWVQQLHLGALRDVNSRYLASLGPNTGFDTIGDFSPARPLASFLDRLDREGRLPKTILYCLNPADNAVLASLIGCFPAEGVRGKMQFGSAWWFNDQKDGMEEQLSMLANMGLLARFVGMLTDSRSFLSFPRHEYFRRILCAMLGTAVDRGELPADFTLLGGMVEDICFNNAREYFGMAGTLRAADSPARPAVEGSR